MPDNPPAFPHLEAHDPSFAYVATGMTLRDWFAGQALAGLCANPSVMQSVAKLGPSEGAKVIATMVHDISNALLAEREKRND